MRSCRARCSARKVRANLPTEVDHAVTVSTTISNAAKEALTSSTGHIFQVVDGKEESYMDSGATHVMLPDLEAFISIHKCPHRTVTLGDESVVPVLGEGTAVFSLNGRVILVRNALYVPAFRNPLYSLQKHKTMLGCRTFSFHLMCSHILFPHFMLQIDDSVDNLVSYRSIGRGYNPCGLAYVEPRASRSSASLTVIEDDRLDEAPLPAPASDKIEVPTLDGVEERSKEDTKSPDVVPPDAQQTPETITKEEPIHSTEEPLSVKLIGSLHEDPTALPRSFCLVHRYRAS